MDDQQDYAWQPPWIEGGVPPREPKKSIWPACLLGCLGMLLLMGILAAVVGYFAYQRGPAWLADFVHKQMVDGIRQSELPAAEKDAIIHQLDRVVEAFKRGEIDAEDLGNALEDLSKSPLVGLGALMVIEAKYLEPSSLSDEEQDQAKRALQRVWRGCVEEAIEFDELETAMEVIADRDEEGHWQLRDEVSDEELRRFIAELKSIADAHEIPDEPFEISISTEVRKIVDEVLGPEVVEAEEVEQFDL